MEKTFAWAGLGRALCIAALLDSQLIVAGPQFRSDVRLVVIHATVTDKKGAFVRNLPAAAFRVFEDGKLQSLKESVREDVPVTLGLLVDDSGSTEKLRPVMTDAFLHVVGALKADDEFFVSRFNMFFSVDLPPTPPSGDLRRQLVGLTQRYQQQLYQTSTRLFDSVQAASDYVQKASHRDKRVLLLITDGKDTTSLSTLKQLLINCRRSETTIYAIGFDARRGKKTLDQITAAGGGSAFYPNQLDDLPGISLRIVEEIRAQYTLTYSPDAQISGGTWRQIQVRIANPAGLNVRCRAGYYASVPAGHD